VLPEMKNGSDVWKKPQGNVVSAAEEIEAPKGSWGPILVEKRPSRINHDEKSIMEKAQERKRMVNQETEKGNSKSYTQPSVLSRSKICSIASSVGVSLGQSHSEFEKAMDLI
jgi:hypothetical protein